MSLKSYLKHLSFTTLFIFLELLFISTLYYFDILSSNLVNYLKPLLIILTMFISSYLLGRHISKNGYLEGGKLGLSIILIFFIISVLFFRSYFKLRVILYYLIILFTSILGSMIGINKSKNN